MSYLTLDEVIATHQDAIETPLAHSEELGKRVSCFTCLASNSRYFCVTHHGRVVYDGDSLITALNHYNSIQP